MRSLGRGVIDICELLCGCWETNLGSLEEQMVLLTIELFSQSPFCVLISYLSLMLCHICGILLLGDTGLD